MSNPIRPHIGRTLGSKNSAPQERAVRTRGEILAVAARHFDTYGYGNISLNTILAAGDITKGACYHHFSSKETIAHQLIADWNSVVDESVSVASEFAAGEAVVDRLTAMFTFLAREIADETTVRAGMKLTLEPTIDNAAGFARWVDAVTDIVDTAITAGEYPDSPIVHRLAWNLCSGTVGAAHAAATLREDIDVATRVQDVVSALVKAAATV